MAYGDIRDAFSPSSALLAKKVLVIIPLSRAFYFAIYILPTYFLYLFAFKYCFWTYEPNMKGILVLANHTLNQCSQRGSPSVLSQDEDRRQLVVPSGHFLKLPGK